MGRRPRAAAVSGAMRHEASLTGAETRASRDVAGARRSLGPTYGGRCRGCGGGPRGLAERHSLARHLTERRSLKPPRRADCAFPLHYRPGGVGRDPPASLRGTMGSGPTGQTRSGNPPASLRGGLRRGPQAPVWAWPHGKAQYGQRASLMARPGLGRDTIGLPVVG